MATSQSSVSLSAVSAVYSGNKLTIFTICFIPVQIVCVALRYFARHLTQASWGVDDVLVSISLISQLCMAGISIGQYIVFILQRWCFLCTCVKYWLDVESIKHAGVGYHIPYLLETAPYKVTLWGKYLVAISILYFGSFNIPKLAILALYHRLFPQKNIRIAIHILMGVLVTQTISVVVAAFCACKPFAANWSSTLPGTVCINKEALFIWSSFPNIVTDIIMLVLPIRIVWNLHISNRLKLGLTITFIVGSLWVILFLFTDKNLRMMN